VALVGICGSRNLSREWDSLITAVVQAAIEEGRGIATRCDAGGDALALRACFTRQASFIAPSLRVFAAFGAEGAGADEHSAVTLVQEVARYPTAAGVAENGGRIVVAWWAGGDRVHSIDRRRAGRTQAMVDAVAASGDRCGLVAFVGGGPRASPGTWQAIRLAHERGIPVVVFPCGCSLRVFPSLGHGHWSTAGQGVWGRAWMWEGDILTLGQAIRESVFELLNWKPAHTTGPRRRRGRRFPMANWLRW
jgi:hypothetical protein